MKTYQNILFDVADKIATITLNRPEALNAMTLGLMAEVADALEHIEGNPDIRALILTSAGRGFCAGQDLKDPLPEDQNIADLLTDKYLKVFTGIRKSRVPVIIAVNGIAAGAGFSLAISGDIIMAAKSAKFIQVFSRIGLVPDLCSTWMLPRAIGRTRALKVMMTNEPITAQTALEWGMITDCLEDDELLPAAHELAGRLAQGPTRALVETRALVDDGEEADFNARFRRELEVNNDLRETFDAREGVSAFLEKRSAEFRGN